MSAEKDVAASLVSWASDVADVIGSDHVLFDPSLVRGMGYYTGSIVELAHPASGSSLGGGGRYDQMVGRFLGDDVPAFGFSLGFERLVEVVEDGFESDTDRVAVVFSEDISPAELLRVKKELIDAGHEVGVVAAKKNMGSVYSSLESQGYRAVALLQPGQGAAELEWRELDKSR
jgi:histidyl-tRNA synthetase